LREGSRLRVVAIRGAIGSLEALTTIPGGVRIPGTPFQTPFLFYGIYRRIAMNVLKSEKREMIIGGLVEGSSIRSIERISGVHRDTIMRLLVKVGDACEKIMDNTMRNLSCKDIEVEEV
jgi:hypothetical protein